jgi:hypothetical protein
VSAAWGAVMCAPTERASVSLWEAQLAKGEKTVTVDGGRSGAGGVHAGLQWSRDGASKELLVLHVVTLHTRTDSNQKNFHFQSPYRLSEKKKQVVIAERGRLHVGLFKRLSQAYLDAREEGTTTWLTDIVPCQTNETWQVRIVFVARSDQAVAVARAHVFGANAGSLSTASSAVGASAVRCSGTAEL